MRGRLVWLGLVASALAPFVAAAPAAADDSETEGPSVCVPPCDDDDVCVGGRCVDPRTRRSTRPAARPPAPQPPAKPAPPKQAAPPTSRPAAPAQAQPPVQAAPPPQAGQPPPGYPPPGTYQPPGYYPPPGYYYPPPGYYPPPRYYYPPVVYQAPRPPRQKRVFLAMPYLGLHSYQQQDATAYGPGLRFGTMLGGRVTDLFSLNGELSFDASRRGDVPAGVDYREWALGLTFSPMVQIPAGSVELVLGPKLGLFFINGEQSQAGYTAESSATGYIAGVNSGLFVPVTPTTSLGVLVSFGVMWFENACTRLSGGSEFCQSVSSSTAKILGLTAAALF